MAAAHLAAYAAIPDVTIVGIATRTPERGEELARRFGAADVYPDAASLLDGARPHGVSVTTRDDDHVAPTLAALERDVGVLLEKPIASDVAGAATIARAVRRTGTLLVPGHILRFTAPYRRLHDEVAGGRVGSVVGVSARRDRTRAIHEHYAHVHPAFLTCVHDIDLALWVTGSRVTRVRAMEHRAPGDPQPDILWAHAELASGAIASFATAYLHPSDVAVPTSDRFEVYGTQGVGVVDLTVPTLTVHAGLTMAPDWLIGLGDGTGAVLEEVRHFTDRLAGRTTTEVVTVDDALHGIRVADAIVRAASSGREAIVEDA
jgi:predicted dehydrogenase